MRAETIGASRAVQRSEESRIGQRERVRRPIRCLDEREAGTGQPPQRVRGRCGEVGVDDERMPVHQGEPRRDSRAQPVARIVDDLRERGNDRGIVCHDEHTSDGERGLDDVAEHCHCQSRAQW